MVAWEAAGGGVWGKIAEGAGTLTEQEGESQTAAGGTTGSGKTLAERPMRVRERAWGVGTGKAGEPWPALDGGVGWPMGFSHVRSMQLERGCRPHVVVCLDARLGDWDPGAASWQGECLSTAVGGIHLVHMHIYFHQWTSVLLSQREK